MELISRIKKTFCHPAEGGLYPGGLISNVCYCFQVDGPITGGAYKQGAYNRNVTVCHHESTHFLPCINFPSNGRKCHNDIFAKKNNMVKEETIT